MNLHKGKGYITYGNESVILTDDIQRDIIYNWLEDAIDALEVEKLKGDEVVSVDLQGLKGYEWAVSFKDNKFDSIEVRGKKGYYGAPHDELD